MRSPANRPRRGLTLVELIVASAVAAVVLVSLTSVVMIAARAVPDPDGPAGRLAASAQILSRLSDELATADRIVAWDDHAITFTVPESGLRRRLRAHPVQLGWDRRRPARPLVQRARGVGDPALSGRLPPRRRTGPPGRGLSVHGGRA